MKKLMERIGGASLAIIAYGSIFISDAMAQASQAGSAALSGNDGLKGTAGNILSQGEVLGDGLFFILFIVGTFLAGYGIFGLKGHVENPANNKLAPELGKVVVGGTLMSAQPVAAQLQDLTDGGGALDTQGTKVGLTF